MSDYKSCHYFENNDLQMNNKLSKIWEKIPKNHSEWDFFFFFLDEIDYCKKSWKDPKKSSKCYSESTWYNSQIILHVME